MTRRYPAYKDSGVEWLGEVPAGWKSVPFWALFRRTKRTGYQEAELLSVYRDYGVIPKSSRDDNFNKPSDDLSAYQLVQVGDLAINKMKAWQGSVAVSGFEGIVSPAYFIFAPLHDECPKYLHYLLRSLEYTSAYLAISSGVRPNQWDLDPQLHSRMPVLVPPLPEQRAIARFLDRETAKIDSLVAEQQRLIDLLREKRRAVISHAVTKGLNPNARMKPSGIDWLGDVPVGWEVGPLKRLVAMQSGDAITADSIETEGLFPVFGGNGLRGFTDSFTHDGNFVLIGRQGALCGNINFAQGRFWASEHAVVVTPKKEVNTTWLGEVLRSMNLNQYSTSAAQPGLSVEAIINLCIPVPPLSEQTQIAERIQIEAKRADTLTATAEAAITLMQERRAALISAAVTGKIDVRDNVTDGVAA